MLNRKTIALFIIAVLFVLFIVFDLGRYFNVQYIQAQLNIITDYYAAYPLQTVIIFLVIYVVGTGLSLPVAAAMTLVAGAIFDLFWGTIIVSFSSSIGATIAFLASRLILRDWVQDRFRQQLKTINKGIEKEGAFYLFTLRLVAAIPFFAINLVMGLTPIKTITFFWVSQIGMLTGTIVYVFAGTQLAKPSSNFLDLVLSPTFILAFSLLAIFPLIAKKIVNSLRANKLLRKYKKPKNFDANMIVIGAGSAGLVNAYIAAAVNAKVILIERHKMGGDCLNTGCVPSKSLIRSATINKYIQRASEYGLKVKNNEVDFNAVMERVQMIIKKIAPHDSIARYTRLGVECIQGEARIKSPYEVEVDDKILTTKNIIIATGARPVVPQIQGVEEIPYYTSDTIWEMRTLPKQLLIIGVGPIGCELAQAFARLGVEVTQIGRGACIMPREDKEIGEMVEKRMEQDGVNLLLNHTSREFIKRDGQLELIAEHIGESVRIPFDQVLFAVGRKANTQGFGLEDLGVAITEKGTIEVNEYLQTNYPNIYACGDVAGPYQFTHTAAHQAWYSSVNSLFGKFWRFKTNYSVIPWATFTDPEIAQVGLNEEEAKEKGISYEVTRYGIDDLDRAIADEEAHGIVKILTVPGKDKILGVTIVGHHAAELITEYVSAMTHGLGLNKILKTIHIYPTFSEANKFAAGMWKKSHVSDSLLKWLKRFHAWQRS